MRRLFTFGLALLFVPSVALPQVVSWESMDPPYFVYNATGASIGWQSGTQHTYMSVSDIMRLLVTSPPIFKRRINSLEDRNNML
jgi:hypothetical protein